MAGGYPYNRSDNFKANEETVTLVVRIQKRDIRFLRLAIEMNTNLPALRRFLAQVEKALPKEDNAPNSD